MSTMQNCIDRARWQADIQVGAPSGRLVDSALLPFGNLAYREAWDLIIASYEDYAVKLNTTPASTFTLAGGVSGNTYQITATDFYKVKSVQMLVGSRWSDPLPTFEHNEWGGPRDGISYRLEGDTLYFEPNEVLAGWTFRLWYVYKPTDLALGDNVVDVNGWVEQYIIDTLVVRIQVREEDSDPAALQGLRNALVERITKMAANRNAGKGRKIARTRWSLRSGRRRNVTRTGYPLP